MADIVRSSDDAVAGIKALNSELPKSADLAARLGQAHAFYVIDEDDKEPLFGFSKFVGYQSLTAETYLRDYKELTGINTEHALSQWFDEVPYNSVLYKALFSKLCAWMAEYGKRPRQGNSQKLRLMILKPECRYQYSRPDDRRDLLNLLIAVANQLPSALRMELKATL